MDSSDTQLTKGTANDCLEHATGFEEDVETDVSFLPEEKGDDVANTIKMQSKKETDGRIFFLIILFLSILLLFLGILFLTNPETLEKWLVTPSMP